MDGGWRRPSRSVMTKMMKESVKTGHPTGLPDKLLRLFAPGPPLQFFESNCKVKKKPRVTTTGIGAYISHFAAPGEEEYEPPLPSAEQLPEPRLFRNKEYALQVRLYEETKPEKDRRLQQWRMDKAKKDIDEKAATYDPNTSDPMIEGDPFKTLFVSRLSYEVTERKLRHEFEEFGPIRRIRLVHDRNTDKPRGYAFIEYEHKADMKEAYKQSDGRKVEGRRILVDVERGRTVENWRPMRLAGGLGGDSRLPKEPRKKMLADAAAKGLPPPAAASTAIRREEPQRGPPRDFDRGPPPGDYRGGGGREMRGPPPGPDRFGGGGDRERDRGPPRGYDSRGGGRDRDYGYGGRDRERGDRDRGERDRGSDRYGDREKRPRDMSPGRDFKRGRHDDDRRRSYDRDF